MTTVFEWLLSNAITASFLAVLAYGVCLAWPRRPALGHACWLLVLLKLITPPVFIFSLTPPSQSLAARIVEEQPVLENKAPVATLPAPVLPESKPDLTDTLGSDFENEFLEGLARNTVTSPDLSSEAPPSSFPLPQPPAPSEGTPSSKLESAPVPGLMLNLSTFWLKWGAWCLFGCFWTALAGTVVMLVITIVRVMQFEKLLRLATPASEPLAQLNRHLAQTLELERVPDVLVLPGKVGPLLWQRWKKPVIVLPAGLIETINTQELQTVLAHELTHYRRGDHLWRYLELAAVAFYWWLPTSWWASRQLRQAEEACCDAGVVASLPDGVASYATALVRSLSYVTESNSPCPALSSGLGPVTLLKRRLQMLQAKVERRVGVRGWLMLLAVAALALPVGVSWADDDDPPPVRRSADRRGEERPRTDKSPPALPGTPVAPNAPASPSSPAIPAQATAPRYGQPALPGTAPALYGYGQAQGSPQYLSEEMKSSLEMAVRSAELDLKTKRIRVRQAERAINVHEKEHARNQELQKKGGIGSQDLLVSEARLDQARSDLELASVEVERAELAVEQAKRRMSSASRTSFTPQSLPPMAPPAGFRSPQPPAPADVPPGPGGVPPTPAPGGPGGGFPSGRGLGGAPGMGSGFGGGGIGGGLGFPSAPGADPFFRNFDRQNTGKIRREDVPEWMRERFFEMVDSNKDSVVDRDEFNANYNRLWQSERSTGSRSAVSRGGAGHGEATGRGGPPPGDAARARDSRDNASRTLRDPRDERIEQLEKELREMRRTLDQLRSRDNEKK